MDYNLQNVEPVMFDIWNKYNIVNQLYLNLNMHVKKKPPQFTLHWTKALVFSLYSLSFWSPCFTDISTSWQRKDRKKNKLHSTKYI